MFLLDYNHRLRAWCVIEQTGFFPPAYETMIEMSEEYTSLRQFVDEAVYCIKDLEGEDLYVSEMAEVALAAESKVGQSELIREWQEEF
jgi:hypothetical protein